MRTYNVTLDDAVGCYAVGNGNVNGNELNDPLLTGANTVNGTIDYIANPIDDLEYIGVVSDWSSVAGPGPTGVITGTVDIASIATGYEDLVLAIKFGAQWVSFLIPDDVSEFTFLITPKQGAGVSHVNLYGIPVAPVPLPAAGMLLLAGLGALGAVKRRRRIVT